MKRRVSTLAKNNLLAKSRMKYQRDLKENLAQKDDKEQRIRTLEQRNVSLQRVCSSLHHLKV